MNKRYNLIISVLIIFILTSMHFSSDKVFAEEEFTIKPGDEHESVVDLKRDLEALGFGNFDNYSETYDDSLKSAVNSFHETFNIGDTEVVNEDTLAKIEALINSPFRNGERHEESIALKEQLTILGYTDFTNPNSFYGSGTERGVREFQSDHDLPESGIADERTRSLIQEKAEGPLRNPMYREDAVELKENLTLLGYTNFTSPNNFYGSGTEAGVLKLQRDYDLDESGMADEATLAKIEALVNSPFRNGERHEESIALKEQLTILGYTDFTNPNSFYGSGTERGVREFQSDHDLPESGIADERTRALIQKKAEGPLRNPMYREDAVLLKEKLETAGFGSFAKTNYFGPQTEATVKAFQSYYGLTEDGIAGESTLAKLDEVVESPFRNGERHEESIALKEQLTILGYTDFTNPNSFYGSGTERGVREFQSDHDLPESGIADERTRSLIQEKAEGPLRNPMYREDAVELKENLTLLGYTNFTSPNNFYGSGTEAGVLKLQRDYDLDESGMADEATLAKIEALVNSPFRNGERHEESIALKEQLTILGYTDFTNPNSFYGSGTERGVREFQNDHDLPESGIADERTRALIQEKAEGPLQNPMYREDAVLLKEKLETAGFGSFAKTNYFGPQTEATVKAFQSYYGLTEDGIAGESTLAKLDEVVESPFQNGETHDESVVLKEHLTRLGFSSFSNPNGFYGSRTTQAVEEFQGHFGLVVNGIADSPTWNKIEEILSSPYQEGESSSAIADYKDMLIDLGFDEGISKGNSNFGSNTTKNVRNFQEEMGLPVSGILDEITIHLLEQADDRRPVYRETEYSVSLSEQLDIQAALRIGSAGLRRGPQTDQYSRNNAYVNNSDINVFEGGSITGSGVRLRTEPDTSSDNIKRSVSNGTVFEYIKSVNGSSVSGNTTWYEIKQEGDTLYVHSSLATTNGKVAEMKGTTEVYESQSRNSHVYYRLSTGTLVGVENEGSSWTRIAGRNWRDAKREDFKEYVDPQKQDEFQHLVLSASVNVPAQQLDNILDGRGALDGMGQAFIDGANQHNVNEAYLISHAILESGHGNSQLSRGIEVGTNSSGNPVLVTSSNRSSLSNIKEVHNMFGIGANDGVAHEAGAIRAYREGWDTREKAIIGGAKFIGERYIHNQYQQNTLYKMRWNPANPGYPQYATDMGWAAKQVSNIKSIYDDLVNPVMIFDIPVYR